MSLYAGITERIENPHISALVSEEVLEPTTGPNGIISPPTYSGGERNVPNFAISTGPIPAPTDSGWYHDLQRKDGAVRTEQRVIVNSLAACADNAETPLYRFQERIGVTLPGFVIDANGVSDDEINAAIGRVVKPGRKSAKEAETETPTEPSATTRREIRKALSFRLSSWELAHRTADSWLMYAQEPGSTEQVWAGDGDVKRLLLDISHESGDTVYAYAPNAGLFGTWLSSGTALRNRIPRSYSCEIIGYGATDVSRGATKLDPTGGASGGSRLSSSNGSISVTDKGKEPSKIGFGQVPNDPETRGFHCELILRQASVSLRGLAAFQYRDDPQREKSRAASRVYVLLAMAGHLLAQENGFLRSECDLVTVDEHWGWRQHGRREPLPMTTPTLDEVREALARAVQDAAGVGLVFAAPIELRPSDAQVDLVVDRVLRESAKIEQAD